MYQLVQELWDDELDNLQHWEVIARFPTLPLFNDLLAELNKQGAGYDVAAVQMILDNPDSYYGCLDRHENIYGLERILA